MKVELLSLYLQYDWSRHRESNPNYGIESPVSLPFRRWRDRNRSDRPPIGSVVPLLSVVFKWCYRHRFASGGVSSIMELVDTIIEPSPSNKRFSRLSVVRIIKRRAKFISSKGNFPLGGSGSQNRTESQTFRESRAITVTLNRIIQVFEWNFNHWVQRKDSNLRSPTHEDGEIPLLYSAIQTRHISNYNSLTQEKLLLIAVCAFLYLT